MLPQEQITDYVARDFINPPIMISKDKEIVDVIEKLTEMGISRLIVHDSGKPIGIITTKDWSYIFINTQNVQNNYHVSLTDIMNNIVYVDPMMSIKNCAKILLSKGISSLSVKKDGHIDGIFTKTDLVKFFADNYNDDIKVSDYMTKDVVSVHQDESVYKVIKKMLDHIIPRIVVTTDSDTVRIITMGDFFRASFGMRDTNNVEESTSKLEKIRENVNNVLIGNKTLAKDIMSKSNLITVNSSDSLNLACKTMLDKYVDAVGVIDKNQKLCGILTKTDVVCAILSREKTSSSIQQMELKKSTKTKNILEVLVVDDSKFSLSIYKDFIQKRGHKVDIAENGSDCLETYNVKMIETSARTNKSPYDMVILDYDMPGLKGNAVAQRILNLNPNQKITIISSFEIEEMQKEFSALADFVEIIEKGTPVEAIISQIEIRQAHNI